MEISSYDIRPFLCHYEELIKSQDKLEDKELAVESLLEEFPAYQQEFLTRRAELLDLIKEIIPDGDEAEGEIMEGFKVIAKEYDDLLELVRSYFPEEVRRLWKSNEIGEVK